MSEGEDQLTKSHVSGRGREEQIAPGVYFSRGVGTSSSVDAVRDTRSLRELSLPELRREKRELRKSVKKLISSNIEMKEIDPNREDHDLTEAISENIGVIAKRRAKIRMIRKTMKEVFGVEVDEDDQDEDLEEQLKLAGMNSNNSAAQSIEMTDVMPTTTNDDGMYL